MDVLIVASIDPALHRGGAERVAAHLAEGLSEDHEVTVLSLAEPGHPEPVAVPWRRVHVPLEAPYHPAHADGASAWQQGLWQLKELHNPDARAALADALDELGPVDVASVHNIQGLSFAAFDALRDRQIPTVYTAHDHKLASPALNRRLDGAARFLTPLEGAYQAWVRRRIETVDRFVTPSRYLGDELEAEGVLDPEDLRVVPNGVPTDVDHTLEDPDPRLMMYGALAPHKGVLAFAKAFQASNADLDLHVAGTGPLQEEIEAIADEDPRITYLGFVDDEELRTRVATSLAVVVPSLWPENCPMVVLESLSGGTPVVHTGRGGLAEICPPGELGLQLPDDPIDWNAFVETLDAGRLAEMRPRCRKIAEQRYSVESMVEAYERTFADLPTVGGRA